MIDNYDIPDEMLASYIDGRTTPLERTLVENQFKDEDFNEILDIAKDAISFSEKMELEPLGRNEIIDSYIQKVDQFQDLKENPADKGELW